MTRQPIVSIVLPTYNGSQYICESIQSCIQQTYKNWELIIIDDASTDNTPSIVSEFSTRDRRIRVIQNEVNQKLPSALNKGFKHAKGKYLTWTSDDNIYRPNALNTMVKYLENHPNIDFVYAGFSLIDSNGNLIKEVVAGPPELLGIKDVVGGCFLYRREIHDALGGYDENLFLAEDLDFYIRAMASFNIQPLPHNLYKYRTHRSSLTSGKNYQIYKVWEKTIRKNKSKMYWIDKDKF